MRTAVERSTARRLLSPGRRGLRLQDPVEKRVGLLAHLVGEVVGAVGMLELEAPGLAVEGEDRRGGGDDQVHALGLEIAVLLRRDDEHVARSQGSEELVEVERDLLQAAAIAG